MVFEDLDKGDEIVTLGRNSRKKMYRHRRQLSGNETGDFYLSSLLNWFTQAMGKIKNNEEMLTVRRRIICIF